MPLAMQNNIQNARAKHFKSLHSPGNPLVLTNVWDGISASAVASLPHTRAIATASAAIAAAASTSDDSLSLEQNLRAIRPVAMVAFKHDLPLTVDLQDGYGMELENILREVITLGAVGINLEDCSFEGQIYSIENQCDRIRRALGVAREEGLEDFVINARTDALFAGGGIEDAIERGKAYLDAGAWNVFVWGGPSREGWGRDDVKRACQAFNGRLNVILDIKNEDALTIKELEEIGVARISVGPQIMHLMAAGIAQEAQRILDGKSSIFEE